jgi:hypothetical protein
LELLGSHAIVSVSGSLTPAAGAADGWVAAEAWVGAAAAGFVGAAVGAGA